MSSSKSKIYLPRMRPLPANRSVIVSVLDVGSSKICCLIARLIPTGETEAMPGRSHAIEVIGYGYQRSQGIKSGVVVNLDQAEHAVRLAVDAAERMAGVTVESLIVNVSCGRLKSEVISASVNISRETVRYADIHRVLAAGSFHSLEDGRGVVHAIPVVYTLDGNRKISDPRGMIGQLLSVDMHVVTTDLPPVRNLELCINRGHLNVETTVATPYASGLATLVKEELELGCVCIDMGGGTTNLSVFVEGQIVHVDAIAIGGQHVTKDIAMGLSTMFETAERLKTLQGSAYPTAADDTDVISVPTMTGDEGATEQISKGELTRIILPRIEELFELIGDRLKHSGFAGQVGNRLILTGGASQLTGITEIAQRIFNCNIRLGRPLGVTGLPGAAKGPAFGTPVGLLVYPQVAQIEQFEPRRTLTRFASGGYLNRFGKWVRESF